MKRFIKKVITYSIFLFVVINLIIYLFINYSPENFLGVGRFDYRLLNYQYNTMKAKSNYRNIVIGDSKGTASISPKILGSSWLNLSIPGSDFFEGYHTLKFYLSKNKIDTLLMYYCPEYIQGNSPFFSERTIPCQFISFHDLKELEKVENKYGYLIHDVDFSSIQGVFPSKIDFYFKQKQREMSYLHFPLCYSQTFRSGLKDLLFSNKEGFSAEELRFNLYRENLGHMNYGDSDFNSLNHYDNTKDEFIPNLVVLSYLDSIMKIAEKNKIVVYLTPSPINETTYKTYKNSVLEKTEHAFYGQLIFKYPHLNFINPPEYMADSTFGDHFLHPNTKGTTLISNNIKEAFKQTTRM